MARSVAKGSCLAYRFLPASPNPGNWAIAARHHNSHQGDGLSFLPDPTSRIA